jgi:cytochrome b involved in lipid metabolism
MKNKNLKSIGLMLVVSSVLLISACTTTKNAASPSGANNQATTNSATVAVPTGATSTAETPTGATSSGNTGSFTLADVAAHNSSADCWTIIDGNVYNLTSYIASGQHKPIISSACGIDSSSLFQTIGKHAQPQVQSLLASLKIGVLK